MTSRRDRRSATGFTLIELLIAITVIAILAGMAIPAIMRALNSAHETAVIVEISQLDMAMEQFKADYGFYPPSFETDVTSAALLTSLVTRMSANNAERSASGVSGGGSLAGGERTRLEHWYFEVGQYLDQESSLVFWLSGVCKNKQYPITGNATEFLANGNNNAAWIGNWVSGMPPLAAHGLNYVNDEIERDGFFEFKDSQLVFDDSVLYNDPFEANLLLTPKALPVNVVGFIAEYRQPHAGDDGQTFTDPSSTVTAIADYRYKYRVKESYPGIVPGTGSDVAYYQVGTGVYANPNRFQIVSFGMDGLSGVPGDWTKIDSGVETVDATYFMWGRTDFFGPWGADNLTNFANGRLEKWVLETP